MAARFAPLTPGQRPVNVTSGHILDTSRTAIFPFRKSNGDYTRIAHTVCRKCPDLDFPEQGVMDVTDRVDGTLTECDGWHADGTLTECPAAERAMLENSTLACAGEAPCAMDTSTLSMC